MINKLRMALILFYLLILIICHKNLNPFPCQSSCIGCKNIKQFIIENIYLIGLLVSIIIIFGLVLSWELK